MIIHGLRFLVVFALLPGAAAIATDAPAKPHIILVMPDDTGYGDYACLGNPITRTPVVDAFKKESLLFSQFHVSPTCSPCRAALMGGRHEFRCGVTHTIGGRERLGLDIETLPQMLASVGYASGTFGKWHLGDEEAYRPESRGFDEVYIHGSGGIGQSGDAPGNTNIDPTLWHNGKFVNTEGYCTDLFFAQAIQWIEKKQQEKQPFFAFVSLNAAHAPHVLPEADYQQYIGHPRLNKEQAKYFGMLEIIDTKFGVLLKSLDRLPARNIKSCIPKREPSGGIITAASLRWTNKSDAYVQSFVSSALKNERWFSFVVITAPRTG
jgi:arylsulfatase